jgi:hypothetical protein
MYSGRAVKGLTLNKDLLQQSISIMQSYTDRIHREKCICKLSHYTTVEFLTTCCHKQGLLTSVARCH